jgi:hypothetical protein
MAKCQKQNHPGSFDFMYCLEHLNFGHWKFVSTNFKIGRASDFEQCHRSKGRASNL